MTITINTFSIELIYLIKVIIKIIAFLAYTVLTIYLIKDVIKTVEGEVLPNSTARIAELNKKAEVQIDYLYDTLQKPKKEAEEDDKLLSDAAFKFIITTMDSNYEERKELRNNAVKHWQWKIGTLITLNGSFLALLKFL